jgi:large repetitive protein
MYKFDRGMKSVARKSKTMILKYSLSLLLFFNITIAFGQDLTQHNWYFGTSPNAIRFNRGSNKAQLITPLAPFVPLGSTGGSAVATDPGTGNLLFYTDGVNVYDACYNKMINGSGLSGNTTGNQQVVISPVPNQVNNYYIFTTTGAGIVEWTRVDLTISGNAIFPAPPLGDVVAADKNKPTGLVNRSEGMIVIPNSSNDKDFWLISHEQGTSNYQVLAIDGSGTFTPTPPTSLGNPVTVANFSYNNRLKKLAVAVKSPGDNSLILNFNQATGALSLDGSIPNSGIATATTESIYDIQWSTKNKWGGDEYLYLSRVGEPGIAPDVLQYNYTNQTVTLASVLPAATVSTIAKSYGLELAPDSAIYHLYQATTGEFFIENFSKLDTVASSVIKTPVPFATPTNFISKQFPAFSPKSKIIINVTFTTAPNSPIRKCQDNPITFLPDITPSADSVVWDFGDGSPPSKEWSPVHKYANAGTFPVTLTAFYQGQKQPAPPQSITIEAFDLQLDLKSEDTACECELPINNGKTSADGTRSCPNDTSDDFKVDLKFSQGSATDIKWSNGQTGMTLRPFESGFYYVVASNGPGTCARYGSINVKQYGLSDQRTNIWYFGDKAGIDFNPITSLDPPTTRAITTSAMTAPEGCSIICDRNGDVIFYTNGQEVFDKNNALIANDLAGNKESAQSSVIVKVPGTETLYYIFTTQAQDAPGTKNELRYSIFDQDQNGGSGAVTQKNILLFAKSTERITSNGQWLIAHELGNSTFRSYKITANGISDPVYSEAGSPHAFKVNSANQILSGQGYMKLGGTNDLAVALSTVDATGATVNLVELFKLNATTGVIDNYKKIDLNQPNGQVYGVELIGRRLFASVKGIPDSWIYEYFIDDMGIADPVLVPGSPEKKPFDIGAIQLAPDGQVFVAVNGKTKLTTISVNNSITLPLTKSTINYDQFDLTGPTSLLGLPNYVQQEGNAFSGPSANVPSKGCVGQEVSLDATPTDLIDTFQWTILNSAGQEIANSTDQNFKFTFTFAGTYTVNIRITNRCVAPSYLLNQNFPIEIFDPPVLPLSADLNKPLCTNPVTLDASAGIATGRNYLWTSGDITSNPTFSVPTKGSVTISYTDPAIGGGCVSKANFAVNDIRPKVDLGLDETRCQNDILTDLDAGVHDTYVWTLSVNGSNSSLPSTRFQPINTSVVTINPTILTYNVIVTRTVSGLTCTNNDQIKYTINVAPAKPLLTPLTSPTCLLSNGSVRLTINASTPSGGPLYTYSISGNSFNDAGFDVNAGFSKDYTSVGAPGVIAFVVDQLSTCDNSFFLPVSDATYTPSASVVAGCDPLTVNITSNAPGTVSSIVQYTATDPTVAGSPITGIPSAFPNFNIQLPEGNFAIQLKDNLGCTSTVSPNPVAIAPSAPLNMLDPTSNVCTSPPTLSATGATSYSWTGPGIVGSALLPTIQVNPGAGRFTYTVKGSSPGLCDNTKTITVDIPAQITPLFEKSEEKCADQVTLTATRPTGSGAFVYLWLKDGVIDPTLAGSTVTITELGTHQYQLQIVDNASRCVFTQTPAIPVTISGSIAAPVLSNPVLCNDGTPFTITTSTSTTGISAYKWFFNNTEISGQITSSLTDTREGKYKVILTKGTCDLPAEKTIIRNPRPIGKLLKQVIICDDPENEDINTNQKILEPGIFTTYNWFYKPDANSSKSPLTPFTTPTFIAKKAGIFLVDITDILGCTNTDQTEVLTECIPKIIGPNAFRPNSVVAAYSNTQGSNKGTYSNQEFFVYSFFVADSDFEIAIFNRWGEIVYESTNKDFKWNGGLGGNFGQPLPGGTYAYVIRYKSSYRPQDGVKEQRGGVVLLR